MNNIRASIVRISFAVLTPKFLPGKFLFVIALAGLWAVSPLTAQQRNMPQAPIKLAADTIRNDILALPVLSYSPEAGFVFGGVTHFIHQPGPSCKLSNVVAGATYSTEDQFQFFTKPSWYFEGGEYSLNGLLDFQKRTDKFYGIGNNTNDADEELFTHRRMRFEAEFDKRVWSHMRVGLHLGYAKTRMLETDADGLLTSGNVRGNDDNVDLGFGLTTAWDSRDNSLYPREGVYYKIGMVFYEDGLASTFSYRTLDVDVRHYYSLDDNTVFAFRVNYGDVAGEAPFTRLAQLGGKNLLRGYFKGRYRDRHLLSLQTEMRFNIWGKFGAALFASAGEVAPELSDFKLRQVHLAAGAGLRYQLTESGLNARIDFGFGSDGIGGPYVTGMEAF